MAHGNEAITDYTAIVTYADADLLEVVDVSEATPADKNKKMTKAVLFDSAPDFGSGLTFGSTLLDTYEQGTWTIGVTFGGASVGVTSSSSTGSYTRVGRIVHVVGFLALTSKGSSNGDAKITGLPFTNGTGNQFLSPAALRIGVVTFADFPMSYVPSNDTALIMEEITTAGTVTTLTDANFADTTSIMISTTYFV